LAGQNRGGGGAAISGEGARRRRGPGVEEVEEAETYLWVALEGVGTACSGGATASRRRAHLSFQELTETLDA